MCKKVSHFFCTDYQGFGPIKKYWLDDRFVEIHHDPSRCMLPRQEFFKHDPFSFLFFRFASIAGVSSSSSISILPKHLNSLTLFISSPPTLNTTSLDACSVRSPRYRWYRLDSNLHTFVCRSLLVSCLIPVAPHRSQRGTIPWLCMKCPRILDGCEERFVLSRVQPGTGHLTSNCFFPGFPISITKWAEMPSGLLLWKAYAFPIVLKNSVLRVFILGPMEAKPFVTI